MSGAYPPIPRDSDEAGSRAAEEPREPIFKKRTIVRRDKPLLVPSAPQKSATVPGWGLERRIGHRPGGETWIAERTADGTRAVVELFQPAEVEPALLADRMRRLRAVSGHPRLNQLLDLGAEGDRAWRAEPERPMSLAGWLARNERVDDPARALTWFNQIAEGLCALHNGGIVHAGLHPENVLLDRAGDVRLSGWGRHLIEHLPPDRPLGHPLYMPAEQSTAMIEREVPRPTWDIYAMGAVVYAMLTGAAPFADGLPAEWLDEGPGLTDNLEQYQNLLTWNRAAPAFALNPHVQKKLSAVVEKCLSPDPRDRWRRAEDVLAALV